MFYYYAATKAGYFLVSDFGINRGIIFGIKQLNRIAQN